MVSTFYTELAAAPHGFHLIEVLEQRLSANLDECEETESLLLLHLLLHQPPPAVGSGGRRDILYFHEAAPLTAGEERGEEVGWNKFHAAGGRFLPPLITEGRVA